jgi:hypothetical protein
MSSPLDLDFEKYLRTSYAHGKFHVAIGLIISVFLGLPTVNKLFVWLPGSIATRSRKNPRSKNSLYGIRWGN